MKILQSWRQALPSSPLPPLKRRQRFDLSSPHTPVSWLLLYKAHATNEYSWCNALIFRPQALQTWSDFPSHCFNVNPIFLHFFARTTPIQPFCFEGWNKFSVPIWRAWPPYWTLKEQLQIRQKSFTEGKWAFRLRLTFFFGVGSDIIFTRSTSRNAFQHISTFATKVSICRKNWLMHVIFIQWDFALPRQSIEMKLLQSWRQALPSSPPPQSFHSMKSKIYGSLHVTLA